MRAHTMQSSANWRYSSVLDMLPSSSHTGGSATGLLVTNAQGSPVGDAQVCASLPTIANFYLAEGLFARRCLRAPFLVPPKKTSLTGSRRIAATPNAQH